jgi:WD40 repeat protein
VEVTHSNEALLCCVFACEGRFLAVGGKDRTLRVYDVSSGKLQFTLGGHQSSICCLCNHGAFLSSGGDHGCSSLIVWDTGSWSSRSKLQLHSAAVTCIVDLQDGLHLASGSFDKKIHIVNYRKGAPLLTATNSSAGVACLALTSDHQRLISAALNNSISVWRLHREVILSSPRAPPSAT